MIINNSLVYKRLYAEFSARFCALDIKRVSNYDFRQNDRNAFLFCKIGTNQQTNISFLKDNGYHQLITNLLMNCELTDILKEASKPYVSEKTFDDIKETFHQAQSHFKYVWDEAGLYISAPEMFVDIVQFPASQFHSNIIRALDTFKRYIEVSGSPSNLFLNSQSPSFFTQFSDFWVANKLGISVVNNNDSVMVYAKN